MAHSGSVQAAASLRAIVYRISSTPTKQLPHIASNLAASLWSCKDLLSTPPQSSKSGSDIAPLIHQLKTSLSSLLQDRTIEGRWAAVVLVKGTIEAGGIHILSTSGPWVKSLLTILKKSDPPTTRILAIIALTRIFMLTWDDANLVREITTSSLPTFITSCLNNIENQQRYSANELRTVLEAFTKLFPRHPTIFRPHESQIRSLLLKILSSSGSNIASETHYTGAHRLIAARLFASLHHCAPKLGPAEMWRQTINAIISSAHSTCDRFARSIIEARLDSNATAHQSNDVPTLATGGSERADADALGLASTDGIFAHGERLVVLFLMLERHLDTATAGTVSIPFGRIIDLSGRLLRISVPKAGVTDSFKINSTISKDERESMFFLLPGVHAAVLQLINTMLSRFGICIAPITHGLLGLLINVYVTEKTSIDVRKAMYKTVKAILDLIGPSMSKEDVAELAPVMKGCCDDLLSVDNETSAKVQNQSNGITTKQPYANSAKIQSNHPTRIDDVLTFANALLLAGFTKPNPSYIPRKLRVQMERTAVLTRHREALFACVLNPARKQSGLVAQASLLPLLANMFPESEELEALLRPRMPFAMNKREDVDDVMESPTEDEESVIDGSTNGEATEVQEVAETGDELADDLLSVLEQNRNLKASHVDEDDLYSATTPSSSQHEASLPNKLGIPDEEPDQRSNKRPPTEAPDESGSKKRLRPWSSGEPLEHDSSFLTEPNTTSLKASVPPIAPTERLEVEFEPSAVEDEVGMTSKHPLIEPIAHSSTIPGPTIETGDEDDDSDMEIPPLNME